MVPETAPMTAGPVGSCAKDGVFQESRSADPKLRQAGGMGPSLLARRLSAWLIDLALLMAMVLLVATLLGLAQPRHGSWTDLDGTVVTASGTYLPTLWLELLLAIASAVYAIPLWRLARGTLGQRLLGLRVFGLEVPSALSWRQAAIRWLFSMAGPFPAWHPRPPFRP